MVAVLPAAGVEDLNLRERIVERAGPIVFIARCGVAVRPGDLDGKVEEVLGVVGFARGGILGRGIGVDEGLLASGEGELDFRFAVGVEQADADALAVIDIGVVGVVEGDLLAGRQCATGEGVRLGDDVVAALRAKDLPHVRIAAHLRKPRASLRARLNFPNAGRAGVGIGAGRRGGGVGGGISGTRNEAKGSKKNGDQRVLHRDGKGWNGVFRRCGRNVGTLIELIQASKS